MKKIKIIVYSLLFISATVCCMKKQVTEIKEKNISPEIDKLTGFFNVCNSDIKNAVKVISERKMIGVLTHLKTMDMEGRKYYLLERENLTDIIKSVTEGTYSDLILINNKGNIIYTMINDDIFGKNVKSHLTDSSLNSCFNKGAEDFYIEDISISPFDSGSPKLFVSFPDKIDNYVRGVFIIQINIEIIEALFEKKITIIGKDGNYRIDKNRDNISKPCEFFDKIDISNIEKIKKGRFEIGDKKYSYYPFNYNSLSWIIISEN